MKKNQPSKNYISMAVEDMKQKKNFLWVVHSSIRITRFFQLFLHWFHTNQSVHFNQYWNEEKNLPEKEFDEQKNKKATIMTLTQTHTEREKQLIQWQIWWWWCCWWLMESKLPTINQPINQPKQIDDEIWWWWWFNFYCIRMIFFLFCFVFLFRSIKIQ